MLAGGQTKSRRPDPAPPASKDAHDAAAAGGNTPAP